MKFVRYVTSDGSPSRRVYLYRGGTTLHPGRHVLEDIGDGTVFMTTAELVAASLDEVLPDDRAVLDAAEALT